MMSKMDNRGEGRRVEVVAMRLVGDEFFSPSTGDIGRYDNSCLGTITFWSSMTSHSVRLYTSVPAQVYGQGRKQAPLMGKISFNSAVGNTATRKHLVRSINVAIRHVVIDRKPMTGTRPIRATIVFPDASIEHVLLMGDDSERFNKIKDHLDYGLITAIAISDQDGPAAVGWVDADGLNRGLRPNKLASALVDRLVVGPMVVTGLGRGEDESMTSIHEGFRLVLDRMAREACHERSGGLKPG